MSSEVRRPADKAVVNLIKAALSEEPLAVDAATILNCATLDSRQVFEVVRKQAWLLGALIQKLEKSDRTWSTKQMLAELEDPLRATIAEASRQRKNSRRRRRG